MTLRTAARNVLLLGLAAAAAAQPPLPIDLYATRLRLRVEPERGHLDLRADLRATAMIETGSLPLRLHPAYEVTGCSHGRGLPCEVVRHGDDLDVLLGASLLPGERVRVRLDLAAHLAHPGRSPGPSREPPPPGVGPFVDPRNGLALPREAFWYPRPRYRDPQALDLELLIPPGWEISARAFHESDTPAPGGLRLRRLSTRGQAAWPLGLAAGPYQRHTLRQGAARVDLLAYPRDLAEHPPPDDLLGAIQGILAHHARLLGPPPRGRFTVVELGGGLPRDQPTSALSQGAFLWLTSPGGLVDAAAMEALGRELSRFWFERGMRADPALRRGLTTYMGLWTLRELTDRDSFLDACRRAAVRLEAPVAPGNEVLSDEVDHWEVRPLLPEPVSGGRNLAMALISLEQRWGAEAMAEGLRRFRVAFAEQRATSQDLLDLLEEAALRRADPSAG